MPSLQESAVAPSPGMDLTRLNVFLDYLAQRLSADDFAEASAQLWAAVDPIYAARRQREAA